MHNINIKFLNKDLALGVKISLALPFLIYKKNLFHLVMNDNAKKILSKKINLAATVFTKSGSGNGDLGIHRASPGMD